MDSELIIAIVNKGHSETVMDSARENGATGGTIINGRGTANEKVEKFFGITIQQEKEIILILVKKDVRNKIMGAINKALDLEVPGKGVIFSLPVSEALGINFTPFE